VKNSDARDADFWRIMSELESQAPPWFMKPSGAGCDGTRIQAVTDLVLFCGDLNYRIGSLPREEVEDAIVELDSPDNGDSARQRLLSFDQLRASIAGEKAFPGFCEGEIKFRPTFKFDKGTSDYDSSKKQRIPAWTDRILYKSKHAVDVLQYDCASASQHSDHRPVYGTFRMVTSAHQTQLAKATTKSRSRRKRSATKYKGGSSLKSADD
jgi:predicted ATPase